MNATPDQLPNDIEEMKRLYLAQAAELAAAKAGLMIYALEIEKLKFQLARLRVSVISILHCGGYSDHGECFS